MNKNLLIFTLNDHTKIMIQFKYFTDKINIDDQAKFIFQYYNYKTFLSYDFFKFQISDFNNCLKFALSNELQIDTCFTKDIGYYWNYYCSKDTYPQLSFNNKPNYSILSDRLIFNSAFIYNDKQGNLVLNVTSCYPHRYSRKKRKPSYKYFLKWMQNYKPIYKQIIPREVAQQWINQATQIITEIDKNTEELHTQGKL